jgi:hypothetical protein
MDILQRIQCLMTPWRMKWYPIGVLAGIFLGVVFAVLTCQEGAIVSGRLGGDFPAFYAAGKLVVQGEGQSIYDPDRILFEQQRIIPTGGYLPFVNPPHFAYFYALFGIMPYNVAFLVHCCFLLLLLSYIIKACISLKYIEPSLFFFSLVACLTFYPLLKSVLGGQNSVLSFFLLFLVWKFADSGREWLAGLCLGALLYKPQFAIPFIGLFFIAGYWRVAVAGVMMGFGVVVGTTFILKYNLQEWFTFVLEFSARDATVNKFNTVSLSGVAAAFFNADSNILLVLAGTGSIFVVISISLLWYRGKKKRHLHELMAAACPAVLLIPQHVMYYDLALCLLSVLLLIRNETVRLKIFPALWLLGFTQLFSHLLGFSPLFFVVLSGYFYFLAFSWLRRQAISTPLLVDM